MVKPNPQAAGAVSIALGASPAVAAEQGLGCAAGGRPTGGERHSVCQSDAEVSAPAWHGGLLLVNWLIVFGVSKRLVIASKKAQASSRRPAARHSRSHM